MPGRNEQRVIAGSGLNSRFDAAVPDQRDAEAQLLEAISQQRLTGLAVAMAMHDELTLSPVGLDELFARHETQLAFDLRLERALVEAAIVLDRAGIPYRALKGPLLAHTVYADPAQRSFGDIDLLVDGTAFDAAIAALRPLGFARRFVEPRRGFDARFSKGACLERGDGIEIDMHRTLAPGAFGVRLGHSELLARPPQVFELAGYPVSGLDRELAFVHACFHAALGDFPPRLVPLRDVVELTNAGFDAATVIDLATEARCESVFQRAVNLVDDELGVRLAGELADWTRSHHLTRFERWALSGYADTDRSYARQVAGSLCAMRSVHERVTYAAALAFPDRDYVRARERSYARRLTRGFHLVSGSRSS